VAGLAEVLKISVGQGPTACAVTPDNSQVYVVNSLTRSISIIDLLSKTVVETIPNVGTEPYDIAFYERSASELFALVTDRALGRVWVFLVR
jgi:YVTN family beta-propeller protein